MNKFIIIFLIMNSYFLYCKSNLEKINALFENANKLYNDGKYLEANIIYRDLTSSNIISKDLYYNLASSYLALGSNGYAILYYEKSLNIAPFDKEIKSTIHLLTGNYNYNSLLIIIMYIFLALFLALFTYLIVLFFLNTKINKYLIILSILFLIPVIISNKYINDDYIISINTTNLYSGRSLISKIISIIPEGKKLRVLEEYTDWYYVKGNFNGWINKSYAKKI